VFYDFRAETDRYRDFGGLLLRSPRFLELRKQVGRQNFGRWSCPCKIRLGPFGIVIIEDDRWLLSFSGHDGLRLSQINSTFIVYTICRHLRQAGQRSHVVIGSRQPAEQRL
jgi:hypothetical protein